MDFPDNLVALRRKSNAIAQKMLDLNEITELATVHWEAWVFELMLNWRQLLIDHPEATWEKQRKDHWGSTDYRFIYDEKGSKGAIRGKTVTGGSRKRKAVGFYIV